MLGRYLLSLAGVLTVAGCSTINPLRTAVGDAIDLCGSVGKLQAANIQYMSKLDLPLITAKMGPSIKYPELTPELRASAMRSISHCINLQLGNISQSTYDKLMTLEVTGAAAAENALTNEQLKMLIENGYIRLADILRNVGVSETAIANVATVTSINTIRGKDEKIIIETQMLADINGKVDKLNMALDKMPTEIVKAMNGSVKNQIHSTAKPLIKITFSPGTAKLDSAALLVLHKFLPIIEPNVQLSVVGRADANGDELRNIELSRQRAQSVATWLITNRRVEPQRIHISALGATKGEIISPDARSVTILEY